MTDQLQAARESFSGKRMTDSQLKEAVAIADILHGEIQRSGSFIEKLTDYAHAFARSEKFDSLQAEKKIRDVYTAIQGRSMNKTREQLKVQEDNLTERANERALTCAETIGGLIQAPLTQPFYQAYDRAAVTLANELLITQVGAKALMKETYKAAYHEDLYEAGRALEDQFHKPVRDAEIAARKTEQQPVRRQTQSRG